MRQKIKIIIDIFLWSLAVPISYCLRLESRWIKYIQDIAIYLTLGIPIKLFFIYIYDLHKFSWRKIEVWDIQHIFKALGSGTFVLSILGLFLHQHIFFPRSIPFIEFIIALALFIFTRLCIKKYLEKCEIKASKGAKRVLIIGAGEAGHLIAKEILRHPELKINIIGFLDDDIEKQGQIFLGKKVLGKIEDLPNIVKSFKIDEILIAIPSASGKIIRKIVNLSQKSKVKYRTIPALYDIITGKFSITKIREVNLEDLLRREPVKLDLDIIKEHIKNKNVLITGAGGSIGSEIVIQLIRFEPKILILLGRGEFSLFNLENKLKNIKNLNTDYKIIICDIKDKEKLDYIFKKYKPQIVFHTAAHKHVPLMELNPDEAIFNNILGTKNLLEISKKYKVQRFINISTDKAVNPTSIMGASKRVAELLVLKISQEIKEENIYYNSVRFGNVLGSKGSVVNLFAEQIKNGGPITITHKDMKRYFMTIPEAVQLVLQSIGLRNKEVIYVLDMGEPVKIIDLAYDMIKLSGLEPYKDIDIVEIGIRPGEKIFEELLTNDENIEKSEFDKIYMIKNDKVPERFYEKLDNLFNSAKYREKSKICKILKDIIPNYNYNL